jgi:Tfp pilus assembly protein PilN
VTLQARLIAALASLLGLAVLIGAALLKGYHMGASASDAKHLAEQSAARDAQDKALQVAAAAIAKIDTIQAPIIQRVIHETTTIPVYADCHNDSRVMRDLNAALTNSEPASDSAMPAASAPQ